MQRKLEGRSLEIGALIDKEYEATEAFKEELHKDGMRRWNEHQSASKERVDKLLAELGALENLDMDHYMIDGTYFEEHQLMFLVDRPEEERPGLGSLQEVIAAMAGRQE